MVELVVVVIILGILTVSIAPQVMKWMDKSKVSADKANANELKYGIHAALTDWQERGGKISETADFKFDIKNDGTAVCTQDWNDGTATETLFTVIDETMGSTYPEVQYDVLTGTTDIGFRITLAKKFGTITVTCEAQTVTD